MTHTWRWMSVAGGLAAVLGSLAWPGVARAGGEGDWFASLYTGEGVEVRNDERVFTLFAVFNALGFDAGPVTRKDPVPKVNYHPIRQQVRARVIGGDPEVRKAADAFFDSKPQSLRRYLSYAVQGGQPPFKDGAKAKELQELKGFEAVLAKAWTGWKLSELMGQVQQDYRKAIKAYLPVVDGPLAKARAALKVPATAEALVVVNVLDQQDSVRAVLGEANEAIVVVGPSDKPNVEGLLREYARLYVEGPVAKVVGKWGGGASLLREAQVAGATDQTVADYAAGLLGTALALKAMDATDAQYEAAAARGYWGMKEVAKMFDDARPIDQWALDALQRVETRRGTKK